MRGSITLDKPKFALLAVALLLMACLFQVASASAAAPEPATLTVLGSPVLGGPALPDCHIYIKAKKFWDKNNNGTKDGDDEWLPNWEITLTKPDGSTIKKTTNSEGVADFGSSFTAAGTYKLTETMQAGWTNTTPLEQTKYFSASGSDVNWTAYFGNWQPGTIIIQEYTYPNPDPTNTSFPFTTGGGLTPASFSLFSPETRTFSNLLPGTYSVAAGSPTSTYMWSLVNSYCDDHSPVSAINVSAGETVTCKFIHCLCEDFGDAPDDGVQYHYNSTLANNGARHYIGNLYLGTQIDCEDDANLIPASPAKGDDMTGETDEDGVDRGEDPWSDSAGVVYVTVTGGDGCLNAWWDITQDTTSGVMPGSNGYFDGADHIITNLPVVPGVNTVNFNYPAVVMPFDYEHSGATYVRFRLSPRNAAGNCSTTLGPVGLEPAAASTSVGPDGLVLNGEVEDYQWGFGSNAVSLQGFTAASQASRSAGLPLLGVAAILVSGLAIVWNRGKKVSMKSEATTVSVETGKTYLAPAIVHEMDLETRAGSPLGVQEFNPVLGPEFQEVK